MENYRKILFRRCCSHLTPLEIGGLSLFLIVICFFGFLLIKNIFKKPKIISPSSNVLITGGCMGLGREVALLFASNHKCNVIIYDIRTELAKDLGIYFLNISLLISDDSSRN